MHSLQGFLTDTVCVPPTFEHQETSQYNYILLLIGTFKLAKHSEMHNLHTAAFHTVL